MIETSYLREDENWKRSMQVFQFHTATWEKYVNEGHMCNNSNDRFNEGLLCRNGFCILTDVFVFPGPHGGEVILAFMLRGASWEKYPRRVDPASQLMIVHKATEGGDFYCM